MLVDANILVYAVDEASSFHAVATTWLTRHLNGPVRVGLPWQSLTAFMRLITNPRVTENPLSAEQAWLLVESWLSAPVCWTPLPTPAHSSVLGDLVVRYRLTGNLISDAHLAGLAIEHGLTIVSADSDFARFPEVRWMNPILPAS